MTPHNKAKKDDIAPVVIMPGDPLRAKWIAETRLENPRLVNDVRGMLAFTGTYKNMPLTVMAHGMGVPSIGIYTWELFKFYDVKTIIRIGSAGSYSKEIHVGEVIIAEDVSSFSTFAEDVGVSAPGGILGATPALVSLAQETASTLKLKAHTCRVFCSDTFYSKYTLEENIRRSQDAKAVEMEGFALYANAKALNKQALVLLTCSDSLVTGEEMSADERQTRFGDMVGLSFEIALQCR